MSITGKIVKGIASKAVGKVADHDPKKYKCEGCKSVKRYHGKYQPTHCPKCATGSKW